MVRELANNQAKWGWGSGAQESPHFYLSNDFNQLAFLLRYCIHSVFLK